MGTAHAGHDQCAHCYFQYVKPAIQAERQAMKGRRALKRQRLSPANRALISEVDLKEPLPRPSKAIRDAIFDVELDKLVAGKTDEEAFEAVTTELVKLDIKEMAPLPRVTLPPKEEPAVPLLTRHAHKGSVDGNDRLSEDQVAEVADAYTAGMVVMEICDAYNIVTTTLYAILRERGIPLRGGRVKPSQKDQSTMPVSDAKVEPPPTNGVVSGLTEWVVTYTVTRTETTIVAAKDFNAAAASITDGEVISVAKKLP